MDMAANISTPAKELEEELNMDLPTLHDRGVSDCGRSKAKGLSCFFFFPFERSKRGAGLIS
jgi:hypothetical protein